ncbi:aminopeptidase P family protein [Agrococcus sp. HG114]|uniref:aminopeptidase P family protein n=1 Tax=Agrococcus sp. HG114 TaxID=2969757 RepID=UPI00215AE6C4|nr:aminopeptidase P family protein [Agrococcus sp. HG114]MCR8671825.1 aminopeptidase P family protein [Agrococcus sp. HG114]
MSESTTTQGAPAQGTAAQGTAQQGTTNRSTTPTGSAFTEQIQQGWAERPAALPEPRPAAAFAAERRARIAAMHPGVRLVIPAGSLKVRSNDTDYPFRPHPDFTYLTGWGSDAEPDSVLVLDPVEGEHRATLYFRGPAGRGTTEFYANPAIGEFWVGPRPSLEHVAADLGLATADLGELEAALTAGGDDAADALVVTGADPAVEAMVAGANPDGDVLARDLSELRLVKDAHEIAEVQAAVDATARGFDDVIADLGEATRHERGERVVEGAFHRRARLDGNAVGYDTIAASGHHACYLHWTRNDGRVREGDLILLDAGVEVDSLYTADITRTLPISGRFTELQRRVYEAVLEAADAAFAVVRPGIVFKEVHAAAMEVIARRTAEWGLLPISAEESLDPEQQLHRRWMVHGTSHHLGLDVHDCAQARRDFYHEGTVHEGMVFTIEPGLYFQADDLTVPEELRGIGVRIEDDILVTADGAVNLSGSIPRTADDVEAWMERVRSR